MMVSLKKRPNFLYDQHGEGFGDHGRCKGDYIISLVLFSIPTSLFLKQPHLY